MGSTVTIDNTETFAMIEGLIRKVEKPEPLLRLVGKYIQAETTKMFLSRPDNTIVRGEKWEPLKQSTIFKKRALSKRGLMVGNPTRPLVRTGLLRDDLMSPRSIKVQNKGLEYGTERRNNKGYLYPAIHQLGSQKNNLPKRRWLFLTEGDLFQIGRTTIEYLDGHKDTLKSMLRHDVFRYGGD